MMAQHLNKARRQGESKVSMGDALKGLRIVDVGCGGGILAEVHHTGAVWGPRWAHGGGRVRTLPRAVHLISRNEPKELGRHDQMTAEVNLPPLSY